MKLDIVQNKDPVIVANLNRDLQEKHVKLLLKSFKKYHYSSILQAIKTFFDKKNTYCIIVYFKDEAISYATLKAKNYQENPLRNSYNALVIDQICINKEYQNRIYRNGNITIDV